MTNYLFSMPWLIKTILSVFFIVPLVVAAEFFKSNYGARFEGVLFAWVLGIVLGVFWLSFRKIGGMELKNFIHPFWPLFFVFLAAFFLGTLANALVVSAMFDQNVTNAALPYAIFMSNSAVAYLTTAGLAIVLPRFFRQVEFSGLNFLGILFVVVGMGMLIWKNH